ncbi:MAG: site-specific DNA-methyltransferase [Spirochaeta sp.]|jgi:DNA modification methylase|nr:site-specific DNA-methyltransferase [Spirochaeta sp.]
MKTDHVFVFQAADDLSFLADDSVDLVVTSPPYPMIEMWDTQFADRNPQIADKISGGDGRRAFELMHVQLDQVWHECARVVRDGGFVCVNIGDATRKVGENFRLYTNHSRITISLERLGFQSLPAIIWRKQTNAPNKFMGSGMLPSGAYVTLEHEYILVFRMGDKRVFKGNERQHRQRSAFFWEERNVWFSDLWDFKGTRQTLPNSDARQRSGAYPFELAFRLINMYSQQADTVLDPFAGTGTTAIAAIASGRNSVNVEIDSELSGVINDTMRTASEGINNRQLLRCEHHLQFIQRFEEDKGRSLAYTNEPHGFRVMTKQERFLTLLAVEQIKKSGESRYETVHKTLGPATPVSTPVHGVELVSPNQDQLSFGL